MTNACTLVIAAAIAPPALAAPQHFEHDLRPPAHEGWREAGNAVSIDGDWALVYGAGSVATDLPALFRRDAPGHEWSFARSLAVPGVTTFGWSSPIAALDPPHAMYGGSDAAGPIVQPWHMDPGTGTWTPRPPLRAPTPGNTTAFGEVLDVCGDTALVSAFRTATVYVFEYGSGGWAQVDSWPTPSGIGSFGFSLDLDGDTAVVFELNGTSSSPSQLHVYTRAAQGWTHSQTMAGGQGPAPPGWLYGSDAKLEGDLLAVNSGRYVEIFRRTGPGQPFAYDTSIDLGPNGYAGAIALDGGTVVVGQGYRCTPGVAGCDGLVEVYRESSCLGPGWHRTHVLRSAHRHNSDVALGMTVAASGGRLIAGMPGFRLIGGPFHGRNVGAASIFDVFVDCDGNGVEDACEIAAGLAEDIDGDGVLDACEAVGRRYCSPGNPTILGAPAYALLQGSDRAADDRVFFTFVGVPMGAPGLMIASRHPGFTAHPGGSNGDLCLGEPVGRFAGRTHSYWFAGGDEMISQRFPLRSPLPGHALMQPGETWYFQGWFREGGSSNFTDGIQLLLQ